MDALEFLRERKRMCNSYKNCEGCPCPASGMEITPDDFCSYGEPKEV